MATPTRYSVLNREGVDVNVIYTWTASTTPETPAPPFVIGDEVLGTGGSQYVFVQASSSINGADFLAIQYNNQANSMTSTNILSSLAARVGIAPSNSAGIPAGAYFWAQINGAGVMANTITTATQGVQLYATASAGVVSSVTTTLPALAGVQMIVSATTTLLSSIGVPMQFALNWPRIVTLVSSAVGTVSTEYFP